MSQASFPNTKWPNFRTPSVAFLVEVQRRRPRYSFTKYLENLMLHIDEFTLFFCFCFCFTFFFFILILCIISFASKKCIQKGDVIAEFRL